MTTAQERKYWRTWADTLQALRELHHTKTADELRHWTHVLALGRDKSHKLFNNVEFDAWLRVSAGYVRMADLDEQLRLQAMPATRTLIVCEPVLDAAGIDAAGRPNYVRAVYKRIQAKRDVQLELEEITDEDIALVYSALLHTAQHKQGAAHLHSRTGRGRARYDHHVGARQEDRQCELAAPMDQAPVGETGELVYTGPVRKGDPF